MDYQVLLQILASLAVGLLIGIERGWSERKEDEGDRVAGLRTFSLIGLLGGVWAQLSEIVEAWVLVVAFLAVVALIVTSHIIGTRETEDVGITTEFAMMLTFSLGAWAAFGYYIYAFSTTAIVVALLGIKPILHRWVSNLRTEEIYSGIKLLLISLVLLPLLPDKGYGPWQSLNPYWIWWMVVLISGISFVGYFAIKYAGDKIGTLLTAITGGLASSTAVTLSMAQLAKQHKNKTLFMGGVVVASSIMFIRVFIEVAIVNRILLDRLWIPIAVMFVCLIAGGSWLWFRHTGSDTGTEIELKNPFNLPTALQFGLLLGLILLLSSAAKEWFGDQGIYVLSLVSGLIDVDAITLSLSRMAENDLGEDVAITGIVLASAMNTIVKGLLFSFVAGMRTGLRLLLVLVASVIPGLIIVFLML
ncbi:MgtC/SapB family protein [Balneolaceae bacterium YR4-1]|uniref:MgtC/SapB family protein n=1 Tax=Halalkalibaculum roseum TaxID=2709311 RepID=A0A6M1T3K7_9BACT|nr:MgtC/SapB family protein [Halalkalibaculum roseum]